jgi:hypothetical protein
MRDSVLRRRDWFFFFTSTTAAMTSPNAANPTAAPTVEVEAVLVFAPSAECPSEVPFVLVDAVKTPASVLVLVLVLVAVVTSAVIMIPAVLTV